MNEQTQIVRKIIVINTCLECPNWLKCKPSKKLTPKQRFTLMTGTGIGNFILKECPLENYEERN